MTGKPTPALEQCLAKFDEYLTNVVTSTHLDSRVATCMVVSKGQPNITLRGFEFFDSTGRFCSMQALALTASKVKYCQTSTAGAPGICNTDQTLLQLTGREAAIWKKFLKGPGCQDLMDATP